MQSYKNLFVTLPAYMTKKSFILSTLLLLSFILLGSCGHKSKQPKALSLPTAKVVVDTTARLSDEMQCTIHVDFMYLKGEKYKVANDSLLKMGLLQPDYFSIRYDQLSPQKAIPEFVRRYAKEYLDIARQLRIKEKKAAQTKGALSIKTVLTAGEDNNVIATSYIAVNGGNGDETKYVIIRNFDPNTGKVITLKDRLGDDYEEKANKAIMEGLTDRYALEDDDMKGLQQKGLFQGIDLYPADNYEITDDSILFIYNPGEISTTSVRVGIEK